MGMKSWIMAFMNRQEGLYRSASFLMCINFPCYTLSTLLYPNIQHPLSSREAIDGFTKNLFAAFAYRLRPFLLAFIWLMVMF